MAHPLELRIAALRRRVRVLLLLHGAGCAAALTIAAWAVLALGDYFWRYEETGVRVLSSLAAVAAVGWAAYRYLLPLVQAKLGDVFLARQIERKFPELRERLSGAVAFLRSADDDPEAGSPALRRAVIHETTQDVLPLPLKQVIQLRPIFLPLAFAAVVVAAVAGLYVADRASASIALQRLAMPWGGAAWPQTYHLKFLNPPTRLASGSRFRAELVEADGAEIPGDVMLQIRRGPNAEPEELRMSPQGGVYSVDQGEVTADFAFRAVGGDDRLMSWHEVQVVDPPVVREIRWSYRYPDYAHWTPLVGELRPIEALSSAAAVPAGTTVEFAARTNKPLREARLVIGNGATTINATLDADRLGFSLSAAGGNAWLAVRTESYRFELIGDDGFAGVDDLRYELKVEADPPPWVKLEKPRGPPEDPRGDLFVTPTAVIDALVSTGDAFTVRPDIGLKSTAIRYSRSDRSSDADLTIPLHAGPQELLPQDYPAPTQFRDEEVRKLTYAWELKPLGLLPGTFVNLYAVSTDYAGQERQSESRRLRIIAPEEILERFNQRQRVLHTELEKLKARQTEAAAQTATGAERLADKPATPEPPTDPLTRALELQRQVATGLGLDKSTRRAPNEEEPADAREGVRGKVGRMLEDLKQNKIDNREVASRLESIGQELDRLAASGAAEQATDRLAESLREDPADDARRKAAAAAVDEAKTKQREVQSSLEAMLGNLAQWEDYGKFHEELSRIAQDQERLATETREHLQQQIAKGNDPTKNAEKRAELSDKQAALARRFESLRQQMDRAQSGENGATVSRAVEAAARENPAGSMREAGEALRNDRVGQAPASQQAALDKLKQVMQALSARNADELAGLVKKLREGEKELASLREEQAGLKKKLRDAEKIADEMERRRELERLSRQQRELQKKTEKLAEQLKRLKAERSAARTAKSGARMGASGQGAEQGDAAGAGDQAEAAEKDLENAQRELAEERKQAEADLANELAEKLEDDLKAAVARQERIIAETTRYDEAAKAKPLSRSELIGLLDLAREQETLEAEARAAAERFESAPAFKGAVESAADEMQRAAKNLRERNTGEATQRSEQKALRRYGQLLTAIKPRKKEAGGGQQQGGGEGGAGGGAGGGGNQDTHALTELVLIKLMQEEVSERTKELDAVRKRGPLTPVEQEEIGRLSVEQGKLADLLLDIMGQTTPEKPDDELLPDLKLDDPKPDAGSKLKLKLD